MFKWGFGKVKPFVAIKKTTLMQQTAAVKDHIFCHFQKVISVLLWKYLSTESFQSIIAHIIFKSQESTVISISQLKTEKRKENFWPAGLSLTWNERAKADYQTWALKKSCLGWRPDAVRKWRYLKNFLWKENQKLRWGIQRCDTKHHTPA